MQCIRAIAVMIAGMFLAVLPADGLRAEILVQGQANHVRVEARDATVAEIFAALGEQFALRYRGTTGSARVTASFEGPLRRVVARVLAGYNYVIESRPDGIEVIVVSAESPNAVAAPFFRSAAPDISGEARPAAQREISGRPSRTHD